MPEEEQEEEEEEDEEWEWESIIQLPSAVARKWGFGIVTADTEKSECITHLDLDYWRCDVVLFCGHTHLRDFQLIVDSVLGALLQQQ